MTHIPVVSIQRLDLAFAPRRWSFADERRAEIDAHFAMLRRGKPDLWNGRVLMLGEHALANGVLSGQFFETDFASLIAWKDWGTPDRSVTNCFAQGALQAADGAFLLGVMAPHTVNAGQIYFPSGTPEPGDVVGDAVDLAGSVLREVAEETGLGPDDFSAVPGWHVVLAGPRMALMQILRAPLDAEPLRRRILDHLASEQKPELADIRIVRGPADLDPKMQDFVLAFLGHWWR